MNYYNTGTFSIPAVLLPKIVQNINVGSTRTNGIVTENPLPPITSVFMPICKKQSADNKAKLLTDGLEPHNKSVAVIGANSFANDILHDFTYALTKTLSITSISPQLGQTNTDIPVSIYGVGFDNPDISFYTIALYTSSLFVKNIQGVWINKNEIDVIVNIPSTPDPLQLRASFFIITLGNLNTGNPNDNSILITP